jgi:hypothetical protein
MRLSFFHESSTPDSYFNGSALENLPKCSQLRCASSGNHTDGKRENVKTEGFILIWFRTLFGSSSH